MATIYFAGSITGGREHAALYPHIVAALQRHGTVLTEHVANKELDGAGETQLDARAIFQRDVDWVDQSDALVADVTIPSLGVGYELGRAEANGTPVLALFDGRSGRKLSAMVRGNPAFTTHIYDSIESIEVAIDRFFAGR